MHKRSATWGAVFVRTSRQLSFLLIPFIVSSCAFFGRSPEGNRLKPPSPEAQVVVRQISRSEYLAALSDEYKNQKIRPVEIFQSATSTESEVPVYRLFDIETGSVYSVLGLENADLLVAVNQRAVVSADIIKQIVKLVGKDNYAQFEIQRAGKPVLLQVTIK